MSGKSNDNVRAAKQRSILEQKFMVLCEKLSIAIEEEETSDEEESNAPKTKRQKMETS